MAQSAEGPVYVHCALGHGRSATVVIAYLLATRQALTVEAALKVVIERRPGVSLRPEQLAAAGQVGRHLAAIEPVCW